MPEPDDRQPPARPVDNRLAYTFAAASVLLRLFPAFPNFQPIGALCLFGGARMRSWRAYVLPIGVMVVADIGLYLLHKDRPFDPFVYGSFALSVFIGRWISRRNSPWLIGAAALASSVQFFLITNFGAWLEMTDTYARSLAGLARCYAAGIPFYRATLAGDLAYSGLFFGLAALAVSVQRSAATAKEPA
jgi:hypothetical protein